MLALDTWSSGKQENNLGKLGLPRTRPHPHVQQESSSVFPVSLVGNPAVGQEEHVVAERYDSHPETPPKWPLGSSPGQAVLYDPVSRAPELVDDPETAVCQREYLQIWQAFFRRGHEIEFHHV